LKNPSNLQKNMELFKKIKDGGRISREEALKCYKAGFFEISSLAQARLEALGGADEVGYIVNRMINYSNICTARCKFCAYHAKAGIVPSFRLTDGGILDIIRESAEMGAVQIMLQGGLHPDFNLDWACALLKKIRAEFPQMGLHVFSPSEIVYFAHAAGVDVYGALARLKDAGANSVPGAADLLIDEIRSRYCTNKCTVMQWKDVMRALAKLGMRSSATMTFGMGESDEQRIEHLDAVRSVQDETGVFDAFIAWPLAPENTLLRNLKRVGSVEFLKTLALARIYLDNIRIVQSGWLTEGLKIAEIALHMGANDVGGVLIDEMVVRAAGIDNKSSAAGMEAAIRAAGKIPHKRDNFYNKL